MKFNFFPRMTEVTLSDLVPAKEFFRPVSFRNTKPQLASIWQGGPKYVFYAPEKSRREKGTSRFFPEVWERIFVQIKKNGRYG